MGVDLNRNWDDHWGGKCRVMTKLSRSSYILFLFAETGVSPYPCSDVYPGEAPLSELETIYTASYYDALDPKPVLVLNMHSALDKILFPYGYRINQFPDNVDEIIDMGNRAIDALNAVHGQQFTLLNAADLCKISRKTKI
jgi:hypothetical protein